MPHSVWAIAFLCGAKQTRYIIRPQPRNSIMPYLEVPPLDVRILRILRKDRTHGGYGCGRNAEEMRNACGAPGEEPVVHFVVFVLPCPRLM